MNTSTCLIGKLFGFGVAMSNVEPAPTTMPLKEPEHIPPGVASPTKCALTSSPTYEPGLPLGGAPGPARSNVTFVPSIAVVVAQVNLLWLTPPPVAFHEIAAVPPPKLVVAQLPVIGPMVEVSLPVVKVIALSPVVPTEH